MKKGDTVTIYHDVLGESDPEGKATLIENLSLSGGSYLGRRLELWDVRFGARKMVHTRSILAPTN